MPCWSITSKRVVGFAHAFPPGRGLPLQSTDPELQELAFKQVDSMFADFMEHFKKQYTGDTTETG